MTSQELYEEYVAKSRKIADINGAISLMHWDQEIYLPSKGAAARSRQIATLSGLAHQLSSDDLLGELLNKLNDAKDLSPEQQRNVSESLRDFNKQKKYTEEYVMELSRATSEAFHAWKEARQDNAFDRFAEPLANLVSLKRKEAEMLGYEEHPYDALLDLYEPGAKTAEIDTLFEDVRKEMVSFVQRIAEKREPEDDFLHRDFDTDKQWELGLDLLKQMGYDFEAGRQDVSAHPFTTHFASTDVRVTTRVSKNNFAEMVWSCIHEGGHALYEQGLKAENYGLPAGESVSLGIHESQSRLWENNIGRGKLYWQHNYPKLQKIFSQNLGPISLNDFYRSINKVKPSLIRIEADELTYHFHILIRFELEKALISGELEVADLPAAWNAKYKKYLNVDVPSDAQGVLQDIHWSHGSFGYFPTYSLGSFYAAQFYNQAVKDVAGLENSIAEGDFKPMLGWLRENVHQYGRLYNASELCEKVCGEKLNFRHFLNYANKKYGEIYGLSN